MVYLTKSCQRKQPLPGCFYFLQHSSRGLFVFRAFLTKVLLFFSQMGKNVAIVWATLVERLREELREELREGSGKRWPKNHAPEDGV